MQSLDPVGGGFACVSPTCQSWSSEVHVAVDVARPGIHDVAPVVDPSARVVEHVAGNRELLKSPRVGPVCFRQVKPNG